MFIFRIDGLYANCSSRSSYFPHSVTGSCWRSHSAVHYMQYIMNHVPSFSEWFEPDTNCRFSSSSFPHLLPGALRCTWFLVRILAGQWTCDPWHYIIVPIANIIKMLLLFLALIQRTQSLRQMTKFLKNCYLISLFHISDSSDNAMSVFRLF